jgi:predicted nucleotidyltransferase
MIGIDDRKKELLCDWAKANSAVASLWLFGSRARDEHHPGSDYDIAIELKPKIKPDHDWAFGAYVALREEWKAELKALIGWDIDLVAFRDDLEGRFDPRDKGVELWPHSG